MARFLLGKAAVRKIHTAVEALFTRAKARLLGRDYGPKVIAFGRAVDHRPDLSLPGIFDAASRAQGFAPNERLRTSLTDIAAGYLDAYQELAKVNTVHAVQAFLSDAETQGVNTDVKTVLGGELSRVMATATQNVRKVLESETTKVRNAGSLDAITKIAAVTGAADPVVFFVVVRDGHRCAECTRLHLMEDGVTPRCYLLSEVSHGYHQRGTDTVCVGGLHPHCRCTLTILAKGFGFGPGGLVVYVGPDHNEFAKQRRGEEV